MIISIFNVYDQITPYKFKNFKKKMQFLIFLKLALNHLKSFLLINIL